MNNLTTQSGTALLLQAAHDLLQTRDTNRVMSIIVSIARKITDAEGATFILREIDSCFFADEDAIQPLWKGSRFPIHQRIEDHAIENKQTLCIEDIYTDKRIDKEVYQSTFIRSLVVVPFHNNTSTGAIGIYRSGVHLHR
jgi:GAF domain-containing protein